MRRYEDRPDNLEDVCLADLASLCDLHSHQNHRDPADIHYLCYSIDDSLKYKREVVTLFLTFRWKVYILDNNAFEHMYAVNVDATVLRRSEYNSKFDVHHLRDICFQMCADSSQDSQMRNGNEGLLGAPEDNLVVAKSCCTDDW
ncbi:hypothetical protein HPB51_008201 [Rhipicephalus microplus]|uniref:Uncharacterized protein n=1 Tax=Rhipicephalus microplus TaxID=6941 RepID=A0A9J6D9K9_RHIMP|nr:hypothetical protein HPB51_008201 [Rhipicephalus microplus]